jgi:hypothetical protein
MRASRYTEAVKHAITLLVAGALFLACDPHQASAPPAAPPMSPPTSPPASSPPQAPAVNAGTPAAANPVDAGSASDSGSLEGTACGYACGGMACDLACANDELFHCEPQGVWRLQENCAASGKKCVFTVIGGGPAATRSCK